MLFEIGERLKVSRRVASANWQRSIKPIKHLALIRDFSSDRHSSSSRIEMLLGLLLALLGWLPSAQSQEPQLIEQRARLLHITFPLAGIDDQRVRKQVEQLLEEARGNARPVVVFRLEPSPDSRS